MIDYESFNIMFKPDETRDGKTRIFSYKSVSNDPILNFQTENKHLKGISLQKS